jgi:hypothetical protein
MNCIIAAAHNTTAKINGKRGRDAPEEVHESFPSQQTMVLHELRGSRLHGYNRDKQCAGEETY